MTAQQFIEFWKTTYSKPAFMSQKFTKEFSHRWFRIHSLPKSKRYPNNASEWKLILNRQNKIITDLLNNHTKFLLVTGEYSSEQYEELYKIDDVASVNQLSFITLEHINLYENNPEDYDEGQFYTPMFCTLEWAPNKFDDLLKDIGEDNLRAFFVSPDNELIIAPYDGGMDFILKDTETRDFYKQKYSSWLSARGDGL